MKRIVEKNKTYRIVNKKTGKTCLFHVQEIQDTFLRLKDLKSNEVKKFNRKSFETKLDAGEIYVSAAIE
jgi:hypothetical protein